MPGSMEVIDLSGKPFAWVTRAPADYMMVFVEDSEGEHAVVSARYGDESELQGAANGLEGAEIAESELRVYCTLPGEADRVLARLQGTSAETAWINRGEIAFVAVGSGSGTSPEAADNRRNVDAQVVLSWGGEGPRRYALEEFCAECGEFRGRINVLPQGGMLIDTRLLRCRCEQSISCRYCEGGKVRRPLSEHFDLERRSGSAPWFGYLVPCGSCQVAGRGPRVQMST